MKQRARGFLPSVLALVTAAACARTTRVDPAQSESPSRTPPPPPADTATTSAPPGNDATTGVATDASGGIRSDVDATVSETWHPRARGVIDGPHTIPLSPDRPIFYALPPKETWPGRVVGHIHGICGPPSYACGKWLSAGAEVGVLVCPTGNDHCGDSPSGPPSWEAPSWKELLSIMDRDLETSIAKVEAQHPGSMRKDGAVLTGYSRGAYAAAAIAPMHKGRWPYLVLIEADVTLSAATLRAAGVRAVALVAGEIGNEIAGERATAAALEKEGFPARLFVMKRTGHLYSEDMEYVMHDALTFVLSH